MIDPYDLIRAEADVAKQESNYALTQELTRLRKCESWLSTILIDAESGPTTMAGDGYQGKWVFLSKDLMAQVRESLK